MVNSLSLKNHPCSLQNYFEENSGQLNMLSISISGHTSKRQLFLLIIFLQNHYCKPQKLTFLYHHTLQISGISLFYFILYFTLFMVLSKSGSKLWHCDCHPGCLILLLSIEFPSFLTLSLVIPFVIYFWKVGSFS